MQTPPPVSSDPLREAFDEWWSTQAINAGTGALNNALRDVALKGWQARATLTTIPSATEPDRNAAPEGWKLLKDTTQDERSWPEDYVDENGQYFNTCHNCLRVFLGYKRRGTCKVCATRTATKD